MEDCPVLLVWCADLSRTKQMGERHNYPTEATGFLESYMVAVVDAALAGGGVVRAGAGRCCAGCSRRSASPGRRPSSGSS